MDHRRLWFLPVALLALDACIPTSTPGELGNGSFGYVCPNGSDNACDDVTETSIAIPGAIAVGATFSITYQSTSGVAALQTEPATPSILGGGEGSFAFVRAGSAGILVTGTGGIVDFAELTGEDVATIGVFDPTPGFSCPALPPPEQDGGADAGADDAGLPDAGPAGSDGGSGGPALGSVATGTSLTLAFEPVDSHGTKLAGDMPAQVTSADPGIVSVTPSSFASGAHAFDLCGMAVGTTAITVTLGGLTVVLPMTVSVQP